MDIAVHTGVTKTVSGTAVLSQSWKTKGDERVLLLLQVIAGEAEGRTLLAECETVIQHALLETEGEAWARLDGTLKELNGLLKGLLLSHAMTEVHAIVGIVDKAGTLHVSHAGRGEAYLVRGGVANQITEFTRGKPVSAFIHISSGPLEGGDTVVLSTQRLLRAFTPAQLAQAAARGEQLLADVTTTLEDEREVASVGMIKVAGAKRVPTPTGRGGAVPSRRLQQRGGKVALSSHVTRAWGFVAPKIVSLAKSGAGRLSGGSAFGQRVKEGTATFLSDLRNPERKRRAHLLLLAGAVATFLVVFLVVQVTVISQRSKTRAELSTLVTKIGEEINTAENRRLAGDTDAANQILDRADAWAKQVIDNESGLFRVEAGDLLDRIRSKREEVNNVVRLSPRVLVNVAAKNASVSAQGLISVADGEFIVYDKDQWYHILLNGVDDPKKLTDDGLIVAAAAFPRFKTQIFLTTGNGLVELQSGQGVSMKTDDAAGWANGKDVETYLRYLYVLTADNQIQKYERLTNRYGPASKYNVSGDLTGSLDMTIDSSVYVLKDGGTVVKLFRGEAQPFVIRRMPVGELKTATKIVKVSGSNFYFLDPTGKRIIVVSDGGQSGESSYLKQYVLEGDQIGTLKDLVVDTDEGHMYVLDEKRVYVVDLVK